MSVFVGSLNNFSRTQSGFRRWSPVKQQCKRIIQYGDSVTLLSKVFRNDLQSLNEFGNDVVGNIAIQSSGCNIEHNPNGVEITTCLLDSEYICNTIDVINGCSVLVHNNDAVCNLEDMQLLHQSKLSIFVGPTRNPEMLCIPSVYLEWNITNLRETANDLLSKGCRNIVLGNADSVILKNADIDVIKNVKSLQDVFVADLVHNLIRNEGNLQRAFESTCDV